MATIRRKGAGWEAMVRRKGYPAASKSFRTKAQAERWATDAESQMGNGSYLHDPASAALTLGDVIDKYIKLISPTKKGAQREIYKLNMLKAHEIALRRVNKITGQDIAKFRDDRLALERKPATVQRELVILSHVFNTALKEWAIPLPRGNPVALIRRPSGDEKRDRRLVCDEEKRLLEAAGKYQGEPIHAIIVIAIETGARRGEILSMRTMHVDLEAGSWRIPETKTDVPRTVPLTKKAIDAIKLLEADEHGYLFKSRPESVSRAFLEVCKRAKIPGLRLHDLRHEATSRLFERGLNMAEVAAVTGHKDTRMLMRYTHPRVEDIRAKLAAASED